jgi:hypothetical protein
MISKVKMPRYRHAFNRGEKSMVHTHSWPLRKMEVSCQRHARPRFTPGTHWIGNLVRLGAGLDTEVRGKILCLCWGSNRGRPVCSQDTIVTELRGDDKWVINWKGFVRKRSWPNCEVLSRHLPGRTEGNHENLSQDSRSPGRDLNPGCPEYEGVLTAWPWRSVLSRWNTLEQQYIGKRQSNNDGKVLLACFIKCMWNVNKIKLSKLKWNEVNLN